MAALRYVAAALLALSLAGCGSGSGPLDDCGCKLNGNEIKRCVSERFCSSFSNMSVEQEATTCCGIDGATFRAVDDFENY